MRLNNRALKRLKREMRRHSDLSHIPATPVLWEPEGKKKPVKQ